MPLTPDLSEPEELLVAARKKKHDLVIVESPAKAKTIQKYLGAGYEVAASKGHVRDLPKKDFGIAIDDGWTPTYRPLTDRKDVLTALKKQAAKAETVYLAPDPDREGEAIAWHLKEALGLADDRARRVTFNEITKKAVQQAFANPGAIDMDRVAAQEARRILDRVVGYKLSPLLRRKVTKGLSAGRVQSVAVRLIVDREREIQAFKPEEFWKITALLAPEGTVTLTKALTKGKKKADAGEEPAKPAKKGGKKQLEPPPSAEKIENEEGEVEAAAPEAPPGSFYAELAEWDGAKFAVDNELRASAIHAALKDAKYVVSKVEQKDRSEKAPPPFTTSTLQQQASIRLRFTAKRTMQIAQRLYEGVELGGEGTVALITYMRTDSTRISDDALKACRDHIQSKYGGPYLPAQANRFASGKSAQEAHEAVRPTDLQYTPEMVARYLPKEQHALYTLIYRRFVACQMTPAVFAITNVDVSADKGVFKAQGKIMKFDGYRRVLAPAGKQEDATLPNLVEKQALDLLDLAPTQHFTQPPPRFNEASLVKALEKEGIGRPSTYASIINTIQARNYVSLRERRFHATELGMIVTDLLVQHFPKVMDFKFTSFMESELDRIESHDVERNVVLDEFWTPFAEALQTAETNMQSVKGGETDEKCPQCGKPLVIRFSQKTGGKFLGCSGYPECKYIKREGEDGSAPVETEHKCPTCDKMMLQRTGKRGPFLSCSGYPECKTTMNFDAEGKPVVASKPTQHTCEKCGAPMLIREGKRGPFLACSGYPKCKNAKDVDAAGNPIQIPELGVVCEKCGGPMKVRRGPRGPFLGCAAFPKCRSTKQIPDEFKEMIGKLFPAPPKKEVPAIEIKETCPECGGPMKLRPSRRGFFLGCAKYPKCKGTREAPPEVVEQAGAGA